MTGKLVLIGGGLPLAISLAMLGAQAGPCDDPDCEGCAGLREQAPNANRDSAPAQGAQLPEDQAIMGQTAQHEASLKEAIRQDLDITSKARETEDGNVLQYLATRIRAVSQQLLDADLASPRDDEAVASHTARLQHLRYLRGLFEARGAVSA